MTDHVENMLLEHMKRFQAMLEQIQRELREVKLRQSETHAAVLGIRRDQVNDAEITAHMQVQLDGVRDRLDRVERRLDLSN
jgi:hypothetical protein